MKIRVIEKEYSKHLGITRWKVKRLFRKYDVYALLYDIANHSSLKEIIGDINDFIGVQTNEIKNIVIYDIEKEDNKIVGIMDIKGVLPEDTSLGTLIEVDLETKKIINQGYYKEIECYLGKVKEELLQIADTEKTATIILFKDN